MSRDSQNARRASLVKFGPIIAALAACLAIVAVLVVVFRSGDTPVTEVKPTPERSIAPETYDGPKDNGPVDNYDGGYDDQPEDQPFRHQLVITDSAPTTGDSESLDGEGTNSGTPDETAAATDSPAPLFTLDIDRNYNFWLGYKASSDDRSIFEDVIGAFEGLKFNDKIEDGVWLFDRAEERIRTRLVVNQLTLTDNELSITFNIESTADQRGTMQDSLNALVGRFDKTLAGEWIDAGDNTWTIAIEASAK